MVNGKRTPAGTVTLQEFVKKDVVLDNGCSDDDDDDGDDDDDDADDNVDDDCDDNAD